MSRKTTCTLHKIVLLFSPFFASFNFRPSSDAINPPFWGKRKPESREAVRLFSRE